MTKHDTPALRFDGFDGEWIPKTVSEISAQIRRVNPSSKAPVKMISAASGFINQSEKYSSDNAGQSLKKYVELYKGELAYNHGASKLRPFGSCFELKEDAARVPFVYHCFRVPDENSTFTALSLNRDTIQVQLRRLISSGARMDGLLNISFDQYGTVSSYFPSVGEQRAIGELFADLDALIEQHRAKHANLQQTKSALMQRMFPRDGADEPELRLGGFSGAWESRTLSELTAINNGLDYKHLNEGDIPVYGTGGYMLSVDRALSYKTDAIGIGRKGTIDKPYLLRAPFWTVDTLFYITAREGANLQFLLAQFQRIDWKSKNTATGVPSLTSVTIGQTSVSIPPTLEEQRAIGEVFSNLDALITAEHRYITQLTQAKTALLQRMFV